MKTTLTIFGLLAAGVSSMELTADNWDTATSGKTVLIKFQAPW